MEEKFVKKVILFFLLSLWVDNCCQRQYLPKFLHYLKFRVVTYFRIFVYSIVSHCNAVLLRLRLFDSSLGLSDIKIEQGHYT